MAGSEQAAASLVVVDLSNYESRKADIAASLLTAAEDCGFFYLTGHGIPDEDVAAAFALSRAFFATPEEVRRATTGDVSNAHYVLGYSEEAQPEGTTRQGMLCAYDNSRMRSLWPSEAHLPGFKQHALRFMRQLDAVVVRVMSCFALALNLPDDFFTRHMRVDDDDNGTALFFNHYPSVEGKGYKPDAMRIWAHTDFEVLTLLFQSRPGLEVCPGKLASSAADAMDAEKWRDVDPLPGAITCNLGDALQYWTGGRLKSTFHRVRMPRPGEHTGARYSLAYFANAGLHTPLQDAAATRPPVTFVQMLDKRSQKVPLQADPATGQVVVTSLAGIAGGPDFAAQAA